MSNKDIACPNCASNCAQERNAAILLDPIRNVVLMDGYTGGPRGGGELCGGHRCKRTEFNYSTTDRVEVGCHHAEMNVICNAAASGIATAGAWLITTCKPCLMCAKLLHHAGIAKVLVASSDGSYSAGLVYLEEHGVTYAIVGENSDPQALANQSANTPIKIGMQFVLKGRVVEVVRRVPDCVTVTRVPGCHVRHLRVARFEVVNVQHANPKRLKAKSIMQDTTLLTSWKPV